MDSMRSSSSPIASHGVERALAAWTAGREIEHRDERQQQVAADEDEDRPSADRAPPGPPRARNHLTHREARRWKSV